MGSKQPEEAGQKKKPSSSSSSSSNTKEKKKHHEQQSSAKSSKTKSSSGDAVNRDADGLAGEGASGNGEVLGSGSLPAGGQVDPFEMGRLFATYCGKEANAIGREEFVRMMKDLKFQAPPAKDESKEGAHFNAGVLFAKYDTQKKGHLDRLAFQKLFSDMIARADDSAPGAPSKGPDHATMGPHDSKAPKAHFYEPTCTPYRREPISYASPLHQLSALPSEFDTPDAAVLRRDYLHLQNVVEATLAPRIESEVHFLEKLEIAKEKIDQEKKSILEETEEEMKRLTSRLEKQAAKKCQEIDHIGAGHKRILEKMSQFQYLAAGPRPRDALRMDHLPSAHFPILHQAKSAGFTLGSKLGPVLEHFQALRERAQAAFQEQEVCPHPVVMQDFLNLFQSFKMAAQKLADTPYQDVSGPMGQSVSDHNAQLKRILEEDPLPKELVSGKSVASELEALKEQIKVKDQMIWKLVQEREAFEEEKKQFLRQVRELSDASQQEISEWESLHARVARETRIPSSIL